MDKQTEKDLKATLRKLQTARRNIDKVIAEIEEKLAPEEENEVVLKLDEPEPVLKEVSPEEMEAIAIVDEEGEIPTASIDPRERTEKRTPPKRGVTRKRG